MKDCIFCKIARNEIPSERLYENEDLVAVRDIHPAAPTHVLIITKTHVATLNDVGGVQDRTLASLLRAAKEPCRGAGSVPPARSRPGWKDDGQDGLKEPTDRLYYITSAAHATTITMIVISESTSRCLLSMTHPPVRAIEDASRMP
jgi:hypothetical protein